MTRILTSLSVAAVVVLASACASSSAADAEVVGHVGSALGSPNILHVRGTYAATCAGRSDAGTDTWTVTISGTPAVDEVSVRLGDSDCVLTLTEIVTADGTYVGTPGIALDAVGAVPAAAASSFAITASPAAFEATAHISATSFASDFAITILTSSTPNTSETSHAAHL